MALCTTLPRARCSAGERSMPVFGSVLKLSTRTLLWGHTASVHFLLLPPAGCWLLLRRSAAAATPTCTPKHSMQVPQEHDRSQSVGRAEGPGGPD